MAKNENSENVTGGLTAGLEFKSPNVANENRQQAPVVSQPVTNTLTEGYQQVHKKNIETRSAKLNILVKPSTASKLQESVNKGKIRSRNDLINYLLEKYFEEEQNGVDKNS